MLDKCVRHFVRLLTSAAQNMFDPIKEEKRHNGVGTRYWYSPDEIGRYFGQFGIKMAELEQIGFWL